MIRDSEQRLWNFLQIECRTPLRPQGSTKGWVTLVDIIDVPEQVMRGQPGGPFRPDEHPNESYRAMFYEAVRCLPESDQEALTWGYTYQNRSQWDVILRECRRYNVTLRDRLVQGHTASRAHAYVVSSMSAQSTQLLWVAATQLALAGASAFAPGEIPSLAFGDMAAGGGYGMRRSATGGVRISHD